MDSTDPQPQPQPQQQPQPQPQLPPQLQVQPQHQQQHQQHQYHHHQQHQRQPPPPNTQHIQQSQTQIHQQPAHPSQHQHAQSAGYAPHAMQYTGYPPHFQRHQYSGAYPTPLTHAYAPNISTYAYTPPQFAPWPTQAPNYPTPPTATPSSQEISSTPHVTTPLTPRPKKLAIIKDPNTNQELDLKEELKSSTAKTTTQSSTITTTTVVAAKNNPPTSANTNNATNAVTTSSNDRTNTSSPPSVSNILLQKVSEDTNPDKRQIAATTITATTTSTKATVTPSTTKPSTTTNPLPIVAPTTNTATPAAATTTSPAKIEKEAQDQVDIENKTTCPENVKADVSIEESKPNNVDETHAEKEVNDADIESADVKVDKENQADGDELKDGADVDSNDSTADEKKPDDTVALQYAPRQYNPMSNRTGQKKYSRQFLLDVCEKICKLSVFDDDKTDNSMDGYIYGNQVDIFKPVFQTNVPKYPLANRQNDQSRRPNQQNYMGRSSAGQERQRKVIASSSLTNEVELKTVENPWRPGKEKKEDAPVDVVEVESLKKKFRSILNKLTPNNFDNLAVAVTDLNIDTETKLGEVIDIVFAKALAEPGYCTLYGKMCSHLKQITAGTTNFGNTLLKRCQHQFQSDIYSGLNLDERRKKIDEEKDPEMKKHLNEELYEDMFRCRMRGLGLIKFIGELYKIGMLNDAIMMDCISRLLVDTSEESLECLCDLLATVGQRLDKSSQSSAKEEKKAHKGPSKANAYSSGKSAASVVASGNAQQKTTTEAVTLNDIFDQLHKIRNNKDLPLSLRIRFKLLDVCELREKDNWQSKNTKDNNPKKITEIREAHMEKLESERRNQNAMGPRRSQEGRRGLGHSSGSSSQISSLTNESGVNRGGAPNMHSSASSHSIRDHSLDDNMKQNNSDSYETQKFHQQSAKSVLSFLSKNASNQGDTSLRPTNKLKPPLINHQRTTGGASDGN